MKRKIIRTLLMLIMITSLMEGAHEKSLIGVILVTFGGLLAGILIAPFND